MRISNGVNKIINTKSKISKLIFYLRKPKIVIITGEGRFPSTEAITTVLGQYKKEVIVLKTELTKSEELEFFVKNSSLPILVVTNISDIPPDKDFFAGEIEKITEIKKIVKILPAHGYLILNFDDETVRGMKNESQGNILTFGFQEGADLRVSDITMNGGINFKINYKGSIVPVWLEGGFGKEQIYASLSAAACGEVLGLNLVEISQALKSYKPLEKDAS